MIFGGIDTGIDLDLTLARLLLAAGGSLAVGCAVWAAALLCRRWLPVLTQQRSLWLGAQVAVAVVFLAMLLPPSDSLRVLPLIEIVEPEAAPASAVPAAAAATHAAEATRPAPDLVAVAADRPASAWMRDAGRAWLLLYLSGLAHALWRWWRAQRLLDTLAASGRALTGADHAGLAPDQQALPLPVIEVEVPMSPMLLGLFRPRLLLPRHLREVEVFQQRLIVAHELTHWRRRDLHWSAAALVLQSLFWFNPFMRLLGARLGWAQEFGCDRDVLRGRPPAERKAYAAALVAQLRWQHRPAGMALAFGAHDGGAGTSTLAARIGLIRTPATARGAWPRALALASLAAVAVANFALQPALAWQAAGPAIEPRPLLASPAVNDARLAAAPAAPAVIDCTVMVDAASGATLVREGTCDARVTPASTFKIAISLMGFDSGVLRDDHAPYLPYKASYASSNPSWRHGTDPAGWLRESIVWYSQQVTRRLGAASVRGYVQAFDYGNRDLSSVAGVTEAVAVSELSPTLRISPQEQTVFLRKVVNRKLPLSPHAYEATARLLKLDAMPAGWEVHGKTGTAPVQLADGRTDRDNNIGWFVGWTIRDGRTLVFARLMQYPVQSAGYAGPKTRAAFLDELAQRSL
ncbi:class D beta-lactamase [Duganella sp. Leaf126]|uniref:M56 family metallopeptidase n=1 Tax=Duganella sp. Leaf126 TaxID=1736266 RepID=UPI0006F87849|nr:M56 family metallopeptidase [Duganella sp. Leaf126]KQQ32654.1 class D beta-lactamase [Duganella sp. Leaf126]